MKRSIPFILVCFIGLLGCGDSENKPSTKDYEKQFAVEIPAYLKLSSFDVEVSENVGSKVEPYFKARFKATVKLKTKTFELSSQENNAIFIRPVDDEGEKKEIYGMASTRLSAGNWKMDFNLENNPIPALGYPKDFFTGRRVIIVGTAEESDFKAQQEQKRLVAQQEAEKALKSQQAEQERLNAEHQRKRITDEQERQRRQITIEAERKVAEKAAEERFKAQQAEEEKLAVERDRIRLVILEASYFTPNRSVDVTNALNNLISNDRLFTYASNNLAGDPEYGVKKRLRIKYKYRGEFHIKEYNEGDQIQIP